MFSATYNDYAAYTDAIERVDARFMLQKLQQPLWQIDGLALPGGIAIQHCWSGSGAIAQGAGATGGIELAIPVAGKFTANGEHVPVDDALYMCSGREFMVSIPGVHRWFNVFLPEPQAHSTGLLENARGQERNLTCVLRNQGPNRPSVSALLLYFLENLRAAPDIATSRKALASFEAELLTALETAFGSQPDTSPHSRGRPTIVDKATILRASEAIETSANPNIPAAKLAEISGVSERSLRAGFRKYLGLSPRRYMQLQTLHRARQRLSAGSPRETTVSRVAADLGIWDLGRFAARYRRLFGEVPSATLHRP